MRTCARCGASYPEVLGAEEQACPRCGLLVRTPSAKRPRAEARADPVGAAGLAFRLWVRHPFALLALWFPAFVAQAAALLAMGWYQEAAGLPEDLFAMTDAQRLSFLGVAVPLGGAAYAVELAVWGVVAAFVEDRSGGSRRLAGVAARWPLFAGLGIVLSLTFAAGVVLFVVPFFVFFHWFMFAPAALADGRSLGQAFDDSRKFSRERRTYGFTTLVLLVAVGAFALESVFDSGLEPLFGALGAPSWAAAALASAVAAWPVAPLVALFPASYWALARRARVVELSPVEAPFPERLQSTKCPQCGTLVPYTATGSPVDVTCPVCGRAGRVL